MSLMIDVWLGIVIIVLSFLGIAILIRKQMIREQINNSVKGSEQYEMDYLVGEIRELMYQLTSEQISGVHMSSEVYRRELNKRVELKKALKCCVNGSGEDKQYILDYISDLLKRYYVKENNVNKIIYFEQPRFLTPKDMFDILLYQYKKNYGNSALEVLIESQEWDVQRYIEEEDEPVFCITQEMVREAYFKSGLGLSYEDKLKIIAQRIYEIYKGYGAIDMIRNMDIDGVSGGVSGLVNAKLSDNPFVYEHQKILPRNYESIWIFFKGKSINLSFLSFGSEKELKRVCQNIYRYNKAGQLSEDVGYKVNEMSDGSRVVVVRPPLSIK